MKHSLFHLKDVPGFKACFVQSLAYKGLCNSINHHLAHCDKRHFDMFKTLDFSNIKWPLSELSGQPLLSIPQN